MTSQQRFTFAVCVKCGVQSPPVIIGPRNDIADTLNGMGWQFNQFKFNVLATCPKCQEDHGQSQASQ